MSHIAVISDLDVVGSGYRNIIVPLCEGLSSLGHEVKIIGLQYQGQEHWYDFSIIPAQTIKDVLAVMQNLISLWTIDVLIVALDIPMQEHLLRFMTQRPFKYIGIMPVEAPPLCFSWSMVLMQMDKAFIISEFGTQEAKSKGIFHAEHLPIGVDTEAWHPATDEQRKQARDALGIKDDEFAILTVADNQERKNLSKSLEVFSNFSKEHPAKQLLVTREFLQVGWRLRDLFNDYNIGDKVLIFERGISPEELRVLYTASDVFLLLSKTEGLGMPLLEAMACELPCVATEATGMKELLDDGRGYLVPHEYKHIDPFGNSYRWWASGEFALAYLEEIYEDYSKAKKKAKKARKYVEKRSWDVTIQQVDTAIKDLLK